MKTSQNIKEYYVLYNKEESIILLNKIWSEPEVFITALVTR